MTEPSPSACKSRQCLFRNNRQHEDTRKTTKEIPLISTVCVFCREINLIRIEWAHMVRGKSVWKSRVFCLWNARNTINWIVGVQFPRFPSDRLGCTAMNCWNFSNFMPKKYHNYITSLDLRWMRRCRRKSLEWSGLRTSQIREHKCCVFTLVSAVSQHTASSHNNKHFITTLYFP